MTAANRFLYLFVTLRTNIIYLMYIQGKNDLIDAIIDGLQDKKARRIVVADLTGIDDTICQYFVIAQGGSPAQVHALAMSVGDKAREIKYRPLAVDGLRLSCVVCFPRSLCQLFEIYVSFLLAISSLSYNICR